MSPLLFLILESGLSPTSEPSPFSCFELQKKWEGRFRIEIKFKISPRNNRNLLQRSKISINVVGINGPFNYRSCEIVNAGALLFQANVIEDGLPVDHEGILEEGKHFVSFTLKNFEARLLEYLENEAIASGWPPRHP